MSCGVSTYFVNKVLLEHGFKCLCVAHGFFCAMKVEWSSSNRDQMTTKYKIFTIYSFSEKFASLLSLVPVSSAFNKQE